MEKVIHELKEDFGLDRIASRSFGAKRDGSGAGRSGGRPLTDLPDDI
jgi:hypothetical protein